MYVCMYIYSSAPCSLYLYAPSRMVMVNWLMNEAPLSPVDGKDRVNPRTSRLSFGLYTILPLPILYGMHCNKRWSGGHIVLRNSVGGEGGERGAQTKGVFANHSIDSCTKASN